MELMIGIAILSILIAIAVPSFSQLIARKQVDGLMTEIVGALQLSRSEAIARNTTVSVCTRSSPTACGGAGWNSGLLVFVDDNGNGSLDGADVLLLDSPMDFANLTLSTTTYASSVSYRPDGTVANNGRINACDVYDYGVGVQVNAVGRPRLEDVSSTC